MLTAPTDRTFTMLTFIIPLLSKRVSKSWRDTSDLLDRTLHSIYAQTSDRYQVFIVGNESPDLQLPDGVTFLPVNFPLPEKFDDPRKTTRARERDRSAKVTYGLLHLHQTGDRDAYVMTVDADDLISCRLVEFTERRARETPTPLGWFFHCGYRYHPGSKWIRSMRKGFDRLCGTSILTRLDAYYDLLKRYPALDLLDDELWDKPEFSEIVDCYNDRYRHRTIIDTLAGLGKHLEPLPFPGSIYVQHGNSLSELFLRDDTKKKVSLKSRILRVKTRYFDVRYFGKTLRREFGVADE